MSEPWFHRWYYKWCCVFVCLVMGLTGRLFAQEPTAGSTAEPSLKYQVALASASGGGTYVYVPGRWGLLHVRLVNPKDRPMELLCTTALEVDKNLQFGRRVWVPPHSRLETWHPILMPVSLPAGQKQVEFRTSVVEVGNSGDSALIRDDSGKLQLTGILRLSTARSVTGIIRKRADDLLEDPEADMLGNLITGCRAAEQLGPATTLLGDQLVTPEAPGLEALDQLVISDDRLVDDAAGVAAVRRWMFAGGRVWIALDQVDVRLIEVLLGDEAACEVVDRVSLTTVRLKNTSATIQIADFVREFEQPVDFVRTVVSGMDVAYTVDGWPAAIWKTCGEGKLFVTTLGPRAWVRNREQNDLIPPGLEVAPPRYMPTEVMQSLSLQFFAPRSETLLPVAALQPAVSEFIGYEIPSRGLIIGLLSSFALGLAGLAWWLKRAGHLERLGYIGPLLALVMSGALISIGQSHLHAVPPTFAQIQIVEPISGTNDVRVRGTGGLFLPEALDAKPAGESGGWVFPEMSGQSGEVRRVTWSDLEHWKWEVLPTTIGQREVEFNQTTTMSSPASATITLTPEGLIGTVSLPEGLTAQDAVLATRQGRMGITVDSERKLTASPTDVFSQEQYLAANLLSDQQVGRARLLQDLLHRKTRPDFPAEPTLLLWTQPWDIGAQYPSEIRQSGMALVRLPVKLVRPAGESVVTIPSPLLSYQTSMGPGGQELAPSTIYNHRTREFQEIAGTTTAWFRFQIPPTLLPVAPQQARLTIQVTGPVGQMEVSGFRDGNVVPLKTIQNPVGTVTIDVTDPALLPVDEAGGVELRVRAGTPRTVNTSTRADDAIGQDDTVYWRFVDLRLDLQAAIHPTSGTDVVAKTAP